RRVLRHPAARRTAGRDDVEAEPTDREPRRARGALPEARAALRQRGAEAPGALGRLPRHTRSLRVLAAPREPPARPVPLRAPRGRLGDRAPATLESRAWFSPTARSGDCSTKDESRSTPTTRRCCSR